MQNNSYSIEPDAATASYDMAYAILNKRAIVINNCRIGYSLQGDLTLVQHLQALGFTIADVEQGVIIRGDLPRIASASQQRSFDFNQCTDTFITFAVILACLDEENTSYTIRCIANQRVKECDRIAAVCENLAKFNVRCEALADGIEVFPSNSLLISQQISSRITISCYSDHRIAMAFTHLAIFLNTFAQHKYHVVLDEGNCVSKTFPGFYHHIKHLYRVTCVREAFVDESKQEAAARRQSSAMFVIGMRCSGKSTFSLKMAKKHSMNLICLDERIHKTYDDHSTLTLNECINTHGWSDFRARELSILEQLVESDATEQKLANTIVDCGGGIITTPKAFELLKKQANVVWIRRDISEICADLTARNKHLPAYEHTAEQDYELRRGLYAAASNYVLSLPRYDAEFKRTFDATEYWRRIERMAAQFVARVTSNSGSSIEMQVYQYCSDTFFVCLQFADLVKLSVEDLKYIQKNYTALEVRADAYFDAMSEIDIEKEEVFWAMIRKVRMVCERIRLIFTLRSVSEGGAFKDEHSQQKRQQVYRCAVKEGVFDFFDVEVKWYAQLSECVQSKHTRNSLIVSKHFLDVNKQSEIIDETVEEMARLAKQGDVVKLVLCAASRRQDVERIRKRMLELQANAVVIQLGEKGKITRVENACMTPVYDARFGRPTGFGQMEKAEIESVRRLIGITSQSSNRKCYLFGTDILLSPSPLMHNTAFQANGLEEYTYELAQVQRVEDIERYVRSEEFRGASVTMPFKQEVTRFVDVVIAPAQEIALPGEKAVVNTLLRVNGKIYGYNTDWYGIIVPLRKAIKKNQQRQALESTAITVNKERFALVIGAGATTQTMIYCLAQLGFKTILFNRTPEKITKLIGQHDVICGFSEISALVSYLNTNSLDLSIIASTIPGRIAMDLPDSLFASIPTIFDASYIPYDTPLITQAKRNGCTSIVHGLDMLLNQGYLQNEIFSGQRVDKSIVKAAVRRAYFKRHVSNNQSK